MTVPAKLKICALSHLVWEKKLFQRPQQLMTQFSSRGHHVDYFSLVGLRRYVEMDTLERKNQENPNLTIQHFPFMPFSRKVALSRKVTMKLLQLKASESLRNSESGNRVLWIQNPAYLEMIDKLDFDLLVYDKMDPFHAFKASDKNILEKEIQLLKRADLVFTGGRSLQNLAQEHCDKAICYPSGIDFDHFAKGAQEGSIPDDLKSLKKPILGYFGAVDERIDWEMIQYLCRERAHWNIVFLGPLVLMDKIPIKEDNFHWLGPKNYSQLPAYLRGFDVCLIPWLVTELTKNMSPTKTPEYLAAGKPVVSTPIPDVMADYPDDALIGESPEKFLDACTSALMKEKSPAIKPPQSRTWQEIAIAMEGDLRNALKAKSDAGKQ